MKKILLVAVMFLLIVCSSPGVIKARVFTDNTYPVIIEFPTEYTLKITSEAGFPLRIVARRWYGKSSTYYKPTFFVAIEKPEGSFYEFIEDTKLYHHEIVATIKTILSKEEDIVVGDYCPHLVHFFGSGFKGVDAYIDFDDFYMRIEYITCLDYYDFDDLMYVLENIAQKEANK